MTSNKNQNGLSLDKRDMKHKSAYIIYGNPTPRTTVPLKPNHPSPSKARHNPAPTERPPRSHPRATSISRQSPQPARFHHPIQNSTQNPPSTTKTDRDTGHDQPRGGIPGPPHTGWLNAQCQGPLCAKPLPLGTARRLQRFLYPISCLGKHYQAPCKSAATPAEEESFHLEDFPSVCFITSIYRQYVLPRDY